MIFWALCLIGWVALWFRPEWRWLVVAGLLVALLGPILALLNMEALGLPLPNLLRNVAIQFITGFATFAVPGAAIVLLRQRFMRGAKK